MWGRKGKAVIERLWLFLCEEGKVKKKRGINEESNKNRKRIERNNTHTQLKRK